MRRVYKRPRARRDLIEHYVYLAENAGEGTAERFLTRAEQTFTDLAENREMGASLTLLNAQLAGLRKWRVKNFEKFLIFYFPRSDGVSIVRVLHSSQDWWEKLGLV
jgi:toxin ParE1/3/4